MPAGRVLVIAPSTDLRKSLAFALVAEGYVVTSHAVIPSLDAGRGYDCVVLDHRAAGDAREKVLRFCARTPQLILLAGIAQPWLTGAAGRVVATPVSGEALARAVADVLGEPSTARL